MTACTTRLRLIVRTQDTVDVGALRRLGARGVVKPSATALQVVVGPIADQIAGEIREAMSSMPNETSAAPASRATLPSQPSAAAAPPAGVSAPTKDVLQGLLAALVGRQNVRGIEPASSRL